MRRLLFILLFPLMLNGQQVPDNTTFTLDTVVKVVNPSSNDLNEAFNDAIKSYFNPLYDSIGYAPVRSLLRFRDYGAHNGYELLAEFQTNSPNTTTFDPAISATSGTYMWVIDGVEYEGTSASVTLDGTTNTVQLWGEGTCNITSFDVNSDNIVDTLNLSNDAFKPIASISIHTNSALKKVIFPDISTGTIGLINARSTGLIDTLDLSMFTNYSSSAGLYLFLNTSLKYIKFPSAISSGTIWLMHIYNTGITGTLDLSMFTNYRSDAYVYLHNNSSMDGVTMPVSTTGSFVNYYGYGNKNTFYISPSIHPSMTNINNGIINFTTNGWSATQVNQFLVEIDNISSSGYTGRNIQVGGSNAAPDSSSGGYNGTAAKASLQSKGFTVLTN